jgi:hypothetical protein
VFDTSLHRPDAFETALRRPDHFQTSRRHYFIIRGIFRIISKLPEMYQKILFFGKPMSHSGVFRLNMTGVFGRYNNGGARTGLVHIYAQPARELCLP